ncbi:MAG: hypothetical protein QOF00_4817 [Pseudonocardiales bacterium]|jgi:hypothetical protein|nr:hypothetical protein [Pseudonocardiales bacterium]
MKENTSISAMALSNASPMLPIEATMAVVCAYLDSGSDSLAAMQMEMLRASSYLDS